MINNDTNSGELWINPSRSTDNDPDYIGSLNVEGIEYRLSCWRKTDGEKTLSLKLKLTTKFKKSSQLPSDSNVNNYDSLYIPIF